MKTLTIYEKHPTADAYRVGAAFEPYAIVAKEKRFSEAELAAEFWLLSSRRERMLGYRDGPGSASRKQADVGLGQMDTVLRFASLPHYDEADQ